MATNKNAIIRYKILDQCFRNPGKRYFIEDLINICNITLADINTKFDGISRRQIFEDIRFMESSQGWNISLTRHKVGKRVFYRYEDISFSVNNMPLNEMEINQLRSAIDILGQFRGMPQFQWVQEIVPKLYQGINNRDKVNTIIEFDSNEYLKGIDHLGNIYNAIYFKKVLKISYLPYINDKAYEIIFHPFYLKQYNNRWFTYGYNPANGKFDWNLALDRIINITDESAVYVDNKTIDWKEYFEDIVGVTKPEGAISEKIVLHFLALTGKYVESKPLHGSQRSKWINSETLEITLDLIINYEFERLLLSYCDTVIIIEPESLRTKINYRLEIAITNNYEQNISPIKHRRPNDG